MWRNAIIPNRLILHTTDRITVGLAGEVPVHGRNIVVQSSVVRMAAVDLRRRPEIGVGALPIERRTAAVACWNGGKARFVII